MISELSITLLPAPVDPAIKRCGIVSSAATLIRPLMSLPSATVKGEAELRNSSDSRIWRRLITSRLEFGTSIPTVGLPGIRSIKIDSACRPRHKSSVSVVMREYFTPASGLNSNVVTTGPGLICVTFPCTLNSSNFDLMRAAISFNSWLSKALRATGSCNRVVGGNRNSVRRFRGAASGFADARGSVAGGISINCCDTGVGSIMWMGISSIGKGDDGAASHGARSSGSTIGGESGCSLTLYARGASATGSACMALLRARLSARTFASIARDSRQARNRAAIALIHRNGARNQPGRRDTSKLDTR